MDFSARQQRALEEARPFREKFIELTAQAKALDDQIRDQRKAKVKDEVKLTALSDEWKIVDREAREQLDKAETIENGVFDLKAVNPHRVSNEDLRTPTDLLAFIAHQGRESEAALQRLQALIVEGTPPQTARL